MKILHVTFMFPSKAKPLNGVAVEELVNAIQKRFNDAEQYVLHLSNSFEENTSGKRYQEDAFNYYLIHPPVGIKYLQFLSSSKIKKFILDKEFDLIHFHNFFPGVPLLFNFIKETGLPFIITLRGSCLKAIRFTYNKRMLNYTFTHAKTVALLSDYYYKEISKELLHKSINISKEQVKFIPNFKDDHWALECSPRIPHTPFKLLLIANIEQRKNILNILKAVDKLHNTLPLSIDIYGDVYDQKLFQEIKLFINKSTCPINYYHSISNNSMKDVIDAHDALILLSHLETFGIAYIEAILRERPIIYSEQAGISHFIKDDQFGVPVKKTDSVEEIIDAIQYCFKNYGIFEFEHKNKFVASEVMKSWEEIYTNALMK